MATSMLRLAIVERDLSQRQLAAQVGLHEVTLSRIVRGHARAGEGTRELLARHLDMTVGELFDQRGQPLTFAR